MTPRPVREKNGREASEPGERRGAEKKTHKQNPERLDGRCGHTDGGDQAMDENQLLRGERR